MAMQLAAFDHKDYNNLNSNLGCQKKFIPTPTSGTPKEHTKHHSFNSKLVQYDKFG